jgi:hypothetical protein
MSAKATTTQLTDKLAEVSELLEGLIIELRLHGYEKHDEIIKQALLMQKQIKELLKSE